MRIFKHIPILGSLCFILCGKSSPKGITVLQERVTGSPVSLENQHNKAISADKTDHIYNVEELVSTCSVPDIALRAACVASIVRMMFHSEKRKETSKMKTDALIRNSPMVLNKTTTSPVLLLAKSNTANVADDLSVSPKKLPSLLGRKLQSHAFGLTNNVTETSVDKQLTKNDKKSSIIKEARDTVTHTDIPRIKIPNSTPGLVQSAVLIAPSVSKKVLSIKEEKQLTVSQKHKPTVEIKHRPLTVEIAREFGFSPEDGRMSALASDMMCTLCRHEKDTACVIRWCVKTQA